MSTIWHSDRPRTMAPEERLAQTEKLLESAGRHMERYSQTLAQNSAMRQENAAEITRLGEKIKDLFLELRNVD